MLKKIFCTMFIFTAILFVDGAKVSAQDVWIHTDGKSGTEYYVVTETLKNLNAEGQRGLLLFEGRVKYVRNGSLLATKKYRVCMREAAFSYRIDDSKDILDPPFSSTEGAVARKVCNYCSKHFNIDYDVFRVSG